jgi:hypothetical protein
MTSPLTDEQANEMLAVLSQHFRQPVQPINRYCDALRTWQHALEDRARRLKVELFPGIDGDSKDPTTIKAYEDYKAASKKDAPYQKGYNDLQQYEDLADSVGHIFLQISKSNLLARLLYNGEKLRETICPEHKGRWSGIEWSESRCPHGCQLTGWVQEAEDKGKPLPGVQAVLLVPTGHTDGRITVIKDATGEVLGQAQGWGGPAIPQQMTEEEAEAARPGFKEKWEAEQRKKDGGDS